MKSTSTLKATSKSPKSLSSKSLKELKKTEIWYQDLEDGNLWHGTHGVIVNTAALVEREFFYNIERVAAPGKRGRSKRSSQSVVYA
jgi:hypothetical protein